MKKIILLVFLFMVFTIGIHAQNAEYQKGYTKKNGTRVEGHYKTKKNSTSSDNYSTKRNKNPYTGKKGYKKEKSSGTRKKRK